MVEYNCLRCGYVAKQKNHLVNHLKRKNICKPILEDISIENVKKYYGFEISKKSLQNSSEILQNSSENPPVNFLQKSSKILQNSSKNPPKSSEMKSPLTCPYCYKEFTRSDNLNRHYGRCKIKKKEKDNDKQEIKELKEIVEKLLIENKTTTITNNTNNTSNSHNTTNHMTNNIININNYGDEDTKYITGDFIIGLLKNKPAKTIPELIKYTHFNDAHPENQNIKITNKKEPYIKVRKNDKWELQDKDETISDLIDRQQVHLMDAVVEKKIESCCNDSEKVNIKRCNELYNEENKDYMKRLYNESELVIINNS
tara:strand:+ start:186 stop:1124 length:939 start_codon:yes stop_codon:yes gene_type:complete